MHTFHVGTNRLLSQHAASNIWLHHRKTNQLVWTREEKIKTTKHLRIPPLVNLNSTKAALSGRAVSLLNLENTSHSPLLHAALIDRYFGKQWRLFQTFVLSFWSFSARRDHPAAHTAEHYWTIAQTAKPNQVQLAFLPLPYVKPLLFNRMSLIRRHVVQSCMKNHV